MRRTDLADYLAAPLRGFAWVVAALAIGSPVLVLIAASTTYYRGDRFWWEGVLLAPTMPLLVMLVTERAARRHERVPADGVREGTRHSTDRVRAYAARASCVVVSVMAAVAWYVVWSGLVGVAEISGPKPEWVRALPGLCRLMAMLALFLGLAAILSADRGRLIAPPDRRRQGGSR